MTPPPGQPPTVPAGGYQQPVPPPGYGYPAPGPAAAPQPGVNPYQDHYTVPMQAGPPGPGGPQDDRKKTIVTAVVAGLVVVAALVGTGVFVLKEDKGDSPPPAAGPAKNSQAPATQQPSAPPASDPAASAGGTGGAANPRAGEDLKPVVAGWKVVINPKWGTVFDVPPEWEVATPGMLVGFEDDKNPAGGKPLVTMSAPAYYKDKWCEADSDGDGDKEKTGLSRVGTKGANGAKSTGEVAEIQSGKWVFAGYDQKRTGKIVVGKPKPFTTTSGLVGSVSTATATGVKKPTKCDTDGKATAFGFKNAKGDYAAWVLYSAKGVPDEVPDATIMKILGSLRLAG